MNSQQFVVLMLMLALVGISIYLGHKITIQSITQEKTEEFRNKAFEAAKAEYLEYFNKRFTNTAERVADAFNASIMQENEELKQQNSILKKELMKERKKNESISSN